MPEPEKKLAYGLIRNSIPPRTAGEAEHISALRYMAVTNHYFRDDLRKLITRYTDEFFMPIENLVGVLEIETGSIKNLISNQLIKDDNVS